MINIKEINITTPFIKLGQFLKLTGIIDSGARAKVILLETPIKVNGEIEKRRGRKLYPKDKISIDTENYLVTKKDGD